MPYVDSDCMVQTTDLGLHCLLTALVLDGPHS